MIARLSPSACSAGTCWDPGAVTDKHLHVDARLVHDSQSLVADVGQFRGERVRRGRARPDLVDEIGGKHVFFKGDEGHGVPLIVSR